MPASSAETAAANCLEGTRTFVAFPAALVDAADFVPLAVGIILAAEALGTAFVGDFAFNFEGFTAFRTAFLAGFGGAFLGLFDLGGLCFVAIVKSATYNVYPT
jgi:hypothetical protein